MTTKSVISDERTTVYDPCGYPVKYGRYYSKVQNGANRVIGESFSAPHPYTVRLVDSYTSLVKDFNKLPPPAYCSQNPSCTRWSTASVSAQLIRPWTANDDIALYNKLGKKYDQHEFNAGVSAGELGESVGMIADRAKQLAQAGRLAKRGNLIEAAKVLGRQYRKPSQRERSAKQRVSDGWLELQYGWKPLLKDIYDLSEAIRTYDQPRKARIVARHWIGKEAYCSNPAFVATGHGKYSKQIIAYIEEDTPPLAEHLGLTDPVGIAWELVPFSFVADWFIPIGGWLSARSIQRRAKGSFVLTTMNRHSVRLNSGQVKDYLCQYSELSTVGWEILVELTRTVHTGLPAIRPPVFTASQIAHRGEDKLKNALALVASVFGAQRF